MSSRLALIALLALPLAACEGTGLPGLGTQTPQVEGHKGPPGVSPLEQPIETGAAEARAVSTADAETYNTTAFSARGNEPFWAVDVAGNTAIYKTPENQKGRAIRVSRLTFSDGVEYVGVLNGRPFAVTIRGKDCKDSMSGAKFPMSAELKVSGRTNGGCAAPASAEVASAVAATKAPAPAAPKTTRRSKPKPAATRPAPTPAKPIEAPATPAAETPASNATPTTPDIGSPATDATTSPTDSAPATQPPAATDSPANDAPASTSGAGVPAPALQLPATPPAVSDATPDDSSDAAD